MNMSSGAYPNLMYTGISQTGGELALYISMDSEDPVLLPHRTIRYTPLGPNILNSFSPRLVVQEYGRILSTAVITDIVMTLNPNTDFISWRDEILQQLNTSHRTIWLPFA